MIPLLRALANHSRVADADDGLDGHGNGAKSYTGGAMALGFAAGRRPVASGTGGVSFQYAQQQIESAHKIRGGQHDIPLGPEANELMGFVYMQGRNPTAAMRCYDIVRASTTQSLFTHDLFRPTIGKHKGNEDRIAPDNARLVYLSSYNRRQSRMITGKSRWQRRTWQFGHIRF